MINMVNKTGLWIASSWIIIQLFKGNQTALDSMKQKIEKSYNLYKDEKIKIEWLNPFRNLIIMF